MRRIFLQKFANTALPVIGPALQANMSLPGRDKTKPVALFCHFTHDGTSLAGECSTAQEGSNQTYTKRQDMPLHSDLLHLFACF